MYRYKYIKTRTHAQKKQKNKQITQIPTNQGQQKQYILP